MLVYQGLIPLAFTILFITFLWGLFTFVVAGGPDEEAKEKGKALLFYALLGFLALIVFWGVANIVRDLFSA